jgi:hypothetical protein
MWPTTVHLETAKGVIGSQPEPPNPRRRNLHGSFVRIKAQACNKDLRTGLTLLMNDKRALGYYLSMSEMCRADDQWVTTDHKIVINMSDMHDIRPFEGLITLPVRNELL